MQLATSEHSRFLPCLCVRLNSRGRASDERRWARSQSGELYACGVFISARLDARQICRSTLMHLLRVNRTDVVLFEQLCELLGCLFGLSVSPYLITT